MDTTNTVQVVWSTSEDAVCRALWVSTCLQTFHSRSKLHSGKHEVKQSHLLEARRSSKSCGGGLLKLGSVYVPSAAVND